MEENDNIKKEIADLAPGFPAKPTYEPPAGYFDINADRVMDRWRKSNGIQRRNIMIRKITAIAAIVGTLVIGLLCFQKQPPSNQLLPNISSADAFAYIHENISEFDHLLDAESIELNALENNQLPPSDAEQYLLEELDANELEQLF